MKKGSMGSDELNLEVILKKICLRYFYLIVVVFSLFSVYYWHKDMTQFMYITMMCVLIHVFLVFVPYKLEYKAIKTLIPVYLIFLSFLLYPLVVLYWSVGQVTVFMWYLLIPFTSLIFFPVKTAVYWTIYVLILSCLVFFTSYFTPDKYIIHFTNEQASSLNIMTILCCLGLAVYFIFSLNSVNQTKMELLKLQKDDNNTSEEKENTDTPEDIDKYNELFGIIQSYVEDKKPYCDPNFTITQLASAVDSNITYVSKAIKINRDMNFNVFMNTYRVDMIKNMLDRGYQNTFTIKYIYSSAGFKQQTTFNKVFKQIAGITPTDYIKNQINGAHDFSK